MFLTYFLLGAGLLCLAASILDWHWFFAHSAAAPVVLILGRKGARVTYLLVGLFFGGISVFRMVHTPLTITDEGLKSLTHPFGFSLLQEDAASRLKTVSNMRHLKSNGTRWEHFDLVLKDAHVLYPALKDTDTFSVDLPPAFLHRGRFKEEVMRAASFYFDSTLRPCDNWLLSKTPLDSAEFIVLVWDEAASKALGVSDGLLAEWYRKGTEDYERVLP